MASFVEDNCLGRDDGQIVQNFLQEMKTRFPEFSEQLIVDLIYKLGGNIGQIVKELNNRRLQFPFGENSNEFASPLRLPQDTASAQRLNNIEEHQPGYMNQIGINANTATFQSSAATSTENIADINHPSYATNNLQQADTFNSGIRHYPTDMYLQRRTISDDCISYRKEHQIDQRDRSLSDITGLSGEKKAGNFMQLHPHTSQPQYTAAGRLNDVQGLKDINNQQNYQMPDSNRFSPSQHIQFQIESYNNMSMKVKALQLDVDRIRRQVQQEEDDINASSKVQKNPTERDVKKLKEEILILNNEILKADNELEKMKAKVPSNNAPVAVRPPKVPSNNAPVAVRPPLPIMSAEELRHTLHSNSSTMNLPVSTAPPGPHISGARFPHPYQPLPQPPVAQRNVSPPPDYNDVVNQIPEVPAENNDEQWECIACTFKNHAELPECEVCVRPRL